MKRYLLTIGLCWTFLLSIYATATAQNVTLKGKVRDVNTHREIDNVNVFVKDTQIGVSTDIGGRYHLNIPQSSDDTVIRFQHVAYYPEEIPQEKLQADSDVYLQPRVIPLPEVEVGAPTRQLEIKKDISHAVEVLDAGEFELRGYIDAGDLLRVDHSVQVDEALSGEKTISIRGGNPDDVVVMYNGVKMNSSFDHEFDFSTINLEDVAHLEIIKGSNTALYGSEAFSGVVNIVPRMEHDYKIRFQQRIGSYNSGSWGLHFYHHLGRLHGYYSLKRGASERGFEDVPEIKLTNDATHHLANVIYDLTPGNNDEKTTVSAMLLQSEQEYENLRDNEDLNNKNQLISARFNGHLAVIRDLELTLSHRRLEEDQGLVNNLGLIDREIDDRTFHLNLQKGFQIGTAQLLFGYRYESSELDYQDRRLYQHELPVGLESAQLSRHHHGLVSILKWHTPTGSEFIPFVDINASLRHDRIDDDQNEAVYRQEIPEDPTDEDDPEPYPEAGFAKNSWEETVFKLSSTINGSRNDLTFAAYFNYGSNAKFPTLFQQISAPELYEATAAVPNLNPEKNNSLELGVNIFREMDSARSLEGWQLGANLVKNYYENKFRLFYSPGIPIAFYDNVKNAHMTGLEINGTLFFIGKKITLEGGFSYYDISDKAAFPFNYQTKATVNLNINHAGYSAQIHFFQEGQQTGWIRDSDGFFYEIELDGNINMDAHLSKSFDYWRFKYFANVSLRNILNDDTTLEGIALRDRRYYVSIGTQF